MRYRRGEEPVDPLWSDVPSELERLRQEVGRNQFYLVAALAAIGVGVLLSIALVAFFGLRIAAELRLAEEQIVRLEEQAEAKAQALEAVLARQQKEVAALRQAATDDLEAIRQAHQKIASIRDPRDELSALREANQALWSELAEQRTELLDALQDRPEAEGPVASPSPAGRFQLDETRYDEAGFDPNEIKGFIRGDEPVHRASALPAHPAHLVIELAPDEVALGDPYELSVHVVNRSNGPLDASALRLDWSFSGRNTGGAVPLAVERIGPKKSALLYRLSGQWTPSHDGGTVSVTATLTLDGGARLTNTLHW